MDGGQQRRQLAQQRDRGRLVVDEDAPLAAGSDFALDDDLPRFSVIGFITGQVQLSDENSISSMGAPLCSIMMTLEPGEGELRREITLKGCSASSASRTWAQIAT